MMTILVSGAIVDTTPLRSSLLICEQNPLAYSYAVAGSRYDWLSKKLDMYSLMNSAFFLVSAASAAIPYARRMLSFARLTSASENPYSFIFSTSVRNALKAGIASE